MPIGKEWSGYVDQAYTVLFVCLCVCTVEDFSVEDKASGVKYCTVVRRRPGQGVSHLGELCSSRSPKSDESDRPPGSIAYDVYLYLS